jgi:hypothetical protein
MLTVKMVVTTFSRYSKNRIPAFLKNRPGERGGFALRMRLAG